MLKQLRTLGAAPELKTIQATPYWLVLMPYPSGWYNDRFVAKIVVNNSKKPVDATLEEIKNARDRLGLRQTRFARALGFGGNENTV